MLSKTFLAIAFVPALLSAAAHYVIYRGFVLTAPEGKKPLRIAAAVLLSAMYLLPALRVLIAHNERLRYVSRAAVLWHMIICAAAGLWLLFRFVTERRDRRAVSALVDAPSESPAESSSPEVLPEASSPAEMHVPELLENPARRLTIRRVGGAAALALSGGVVGWGATFGRVDWQIEEVVVPITGLPRTLEGFTIVQISDLHVGTFVGERTLRSGLSLIDALRPDLIAVTGDVIDHEVGFLPIAARALGALRARHGVVCVPGNHDHYAGVTDIVQALSAAGINVLFNRALRIPGGKQGELCIVGVDDLSGHRRGYGPKIGTALAGVPGEVPRVLLAHQPDFFEEHNGCRVDLQLSGHTHGGQINPGFVIAQPLIGPYVAGMYEEDGSRLYVNRGFGTTGPPCRILAPPEITRIVLVAA